MSKLEQVKGQVKIGAGFIAGILVGILFAWIFGIGETQAPTVRPANTMAGEELPPVRHSFSGHSQQRTRRFTLEAGLHTFEGRYRGANNFIVWLINWENGAKVELLTNTSGADSVSKAFGLEQKGRFLLNVEAGKGEWEIAIE